MKMRFSEASVNLSFFSGLFRVGDLAKGKGRREGLEAYWKGKVMGLKLDLARAKGHFYVRDAVQDERIR